MHSIILTVWLAKNSTSSTANGWQFEMVIPWTSIEILADDGYEWHHADGEYMNALICMLDREEDGATTNAYKVAIDGRVSFDPADYPLKLNLSTYVAPSLEVEEEPVVEEPAADTPVETPVTADAGIVAAAAVMAAAAGVVLSKKH